MGEVEAPLDLDGLREIALAIESHDDPNRYRTATAYLDAFRPSTVLRLIDLARLGEAAIDTDLLATALRAVDQMNSDELGVKGPADGGPPPEWYRGYAAAVAARYRELREADR